jgi:malate/lactate dehydrogenase
MERADLLKANAGIFKVQGKALSDYSSKNVKVIGLVLCSFLGD